MDDLASRFLSVRPPEDTVDGDILYFDQSQLYGAKMVWNRCVVVSADAILDLEERMAFFDACGGLF